MLCLGALDSIKAVPGYQLPQWAAARGKAMFPIPHDQHLSLNLIADYWAREAEPPATFRESLTVLIQAWWRFEFFGRDSLRQADVLRYLFKHRQDCIAFVAPGEAALTQCEPTDDGGVAVIRAITVPVPNYDPETWVDGNCADAYEALAERWNWFADDTIDPLICGAELSRDRFFEWLSKRGSWVPKFWGDPAATLRAATPTQKQLESQRLFEERYWPAERLMHWIAFRDPQKLHTGWRSEKRYVTDASKQLKDAASRRTLWHAVQDDEIRGWLNGKKLAPEYWATSNGFDWPPDVRFRRKDVLARWPVELQSAMRHSPTPFDDPPWVGAAVRRREHRERRIGKFTARQRREREWINFAEIADWCAREIGSIKPDEERRSLAFARLRAALKAGEFEQADRARVLMLSPDSSMAKLTRERFEFIAPRFDEQTVASAYLAYCWVPRELCRAWFVHHRLPWPTIFEPDHGEPYPHAAPEPTFRPATVAKINAAITMVNDEAQRKGDKLPNVKQLPPMVRVALAAEGLEASNKRIQELAQAPQHASRRRKPGKTVASERGRPRS